MATQVPSRLFRSRSQKMIAGVCGGLGDYFDVDPVLIRLLFVVTAFISGVGILAYIVLWIVVPFEGDDRPRFDALRRDFDDISGRVREYVDRPATAGSSAPRGDTPPAGAAAPGPATAADAARQSTTYPYEEPPMPADTASQYVPPVNDPTAPSSPTGQSATSGGDELTIGAEPRTPNPPYEDLYGSPYGPPPPYASTAYGADPYTSTAHGADPYAAPAPPPPPLDRKRRRQHWAGAILIVLGLLILGNNLGLLWWVEPEYMLPLILVGAGAWLLFGRGRRG